MNDQKSMPQGNAIAHLAMTRLGEKYVLGKLVPKNDPKHHGPWDCAEFATWLVYQIIGELYGCSDNTADPARADAYTGFWKRDAWKTCDRISVVAASRIPGALVLRVPKPGSMGHIVVSDGGGGTIEAHSTKRGVIQSTLSGRRWDFGILVPGINYCALRAKTNVTPPATIIYQLETPCMRGDEVKTIQEALTRHAWPVTIDGIFGPQTNEAVINFQKAHGLVPDGEVGPLTAEALGIGSLDAAN